jgi:acyl carrier protein
MTREDNKKKLVDFLHTIAKPYRPLDTVDENEGLITSGLIDSLSTLEIVSYLENEYHVNFSERGIDPVQLNTIANILDLIEREGECP